MALPGPPHMPLTTPVETSVPKTQYPPTLPAVRKNMYPYSSYFPPRHPQKSQQMTANSQLPRKMKDICLKPCENSPIFMNEKKNFETRFMVEKDPGSFSKEEATASDLIPPEMEEKSCIIIHAEDTTRKSWISLPQEDPVSSLCMEVNKKEGISTLKNFKRWSFCYGENEKLEILPKIFHRHDSKEKTWLLQS